MDSPHLKHSSKNTLSALLVSFSLAVSPACSTFIYDLLGAERITSERASEQKTIGSGRDKQKEKTFSYDLSVERKYYFPTCPEISDSDVKSGLEALVRNLNPGYAKKNAEGRLDYHLVNINFTPVEDPMILLQIEEDGRVIDTIDFRNITRVWGDYYLNKDTGTTSKLLIFASRRVFEEKNSPYGFGTEYYEFLSTAQTDQEFEQTVRLACSLANKSREEKIRKGPHPEINREKVPPQPAITATSQNGSSLNDTLLSLSPKEQESICKGYSIEDKNVQLLGVVTYDECVYSPIDPTTCGLDELEREFVRYKLTDLEGKILLSCGNASEPLANTCPNAPVGDYGNLQLSFDRAIYLAEHVAAELGGLGAGTTYIAYPLGNQRNTRSVEVYLISKK